MPRKVTLNLHPKIWISCSLTSPPFLTPSLGSRRDYTSGEKFVNPRISVGPEEYFPWSRTDPSSDYRTGISRLYILLNLVGSGTYSYASLRTVSIRIIVGLESGLDFNFGV